MGSLKFPEGCLFVMGAVAQVGSGADVTSKPLSLKNVQRLWILVNLNPAGGAAYALQPQTDALVAFGSAASITKAARIWSDEDADTNCKLTEQTAATSWSTTADTNPKLVVFEIDPAALAAGEDCVRVNIPALAVGDYASVDYVIEPRYPGSLANSPSYIID